MTDRYYIAINGPSVAMSPLPFSSPPITVPLCECLIGFPTLKEAQAAHHLCLTAPIPEVARHTRRWASDPRIVYVVHENPDPPSRGPTAWMHPD